jgi:hypothetical protein
MYIPCSVTATNTQLCTTHTCTTATTFNTHQAAAEKYEVRCSEGSVTLDQLKSAILSLLTNAFGPLEALPQAFADGNVTESNMMAYLGLIEARTNELLRVYSTARDAEKAAEQDAGGDLAEGSVTSTANATSSVLGTGPQVPMGTVRTLQYMYTCYFISMHVLTTVWVLQCYTKQ